MDQSTLGSRPPTTEGLGRPGLCWLSEGLGLGISETGKPWEAGPKTAAGAGRKGVKCPLVLARVFPLGTLRGQAPQTLRGC